MLSSTLKLSIFKDGPVSVRDQLIEQIGLQIASGVLRGKDKLPSIRALAQKLGIHHSTVTAAYNHLAEAGLLEIRQGSGVKVVGLGSALAPQDNSLSNLFRNFLSRAVEAGFSRTELVDFLDKQMRSTPVERILVVDRNPDFHPILKTELQPHFKLPVEPVTAEGLALNTDIIESSLVLTSFYHLLSLQPFSLDPARFLVCTVDAGFEEVEAVTKLKDGSLVLFVSVSPTFLKMATNMVASLKGDSIAVRTADTKDSGEIQYLMKHVNLVVCDSPSEETVRKSAEPAKVPIKVFHLYSESTIAILKERLAKWG